MSHVKKIEGRRPNNREGLSGLLGKMRAADGKIAKSNRAGNRRGSEARKQQIRWRELEKEERGE